MNDVTQMAQLDSGSVSKICQLFDCSIADIVDAAEIGRARTGGLWELERADAAWYFGAAPSDAQYRHVLACFAIEEYYWTLWAIQQKRPDIVNRCYSNAAGFAKRALNLYTPNKI